MVNSLKEEFGVSYAMLGFLLAVLNIVTAAVQIPIGYAADRIGPRIFLPIGLFLMGGGIGAVAFATEYWLLVALMVAAGIRNAIAPVMFRWIINLGSPVWVFCGAAIINPQTSR